MLRKSFYISALPFIFAFGLIGACAGPVVSDSENTIDAHKIRRRKDAGTVLDSSVIYDSSLDVMSDTSDSSLSDASTDVLIDSSSDVLPIDSGTSNYWITGYYAGYQTWIYPVNAIDWSSLTHLAVAFYLPKNDGTLDESLFIDNVNGPALANSITQAAHSNNKKALASIGGAGTRAGFVYAMTNNKVKFISNINNLITKYNYDGIDLDWEPAYDVDAPMLLEIVQQIKLAHPNAIITVPVNSINVNLGEQVASYPPMIPYVDQFNIMSYGMAGPYDGWKTWHSSALYHQSLSTPMSIDGSVKYYLNKGLPSKKIGVGSGFYGLCYSPPVTAPLQDLNGSWIVAGDNDMSYTNIMNLYYNQNALKWDNNAYVPYLSFNTALGPNGCSYISYEDPQSIALKSQYIKQNNLGGAMIWTINQGYLSGAQDKNPLLTAFKNNLQ